jgi:hypothetical protein
MPLPGPLGPSVEELDAGFVVNDGAGGKLGCVHYEDGPGLRAAQQKEGATVMTNFAKPAALLT